MSNNDEDGGHHWETSAQAGAQQRRQEPRDASRRRFVVGAGYAIAMGAGLGLGGCGGGGDSQAGERFGYGVASGDPLSDRVILWTRVNVSSPADVQWEVATDPAFANIVRTGTASTSDARDYTVKVDATGLQPGTDYFYRFHHGGETSITGHTRTLPVGQPQRVRLAVFSCAAYSLGQFHAYADAAARNDFDAAVFLGDYIYETGLSNAEQAAATLIGREIDPRGELHTLSDYRRRYARYHTDSSLRAVRSSMPVIAVWDDHDLINDIWRDGAGGHDPATEGSFIERRAAAAQAWHEWLPTRDGADPLKIYRSFDFGNLLSLHMLDARVVGRDAPISRDAYLAGAAADPGRQMLGAEQSQWLAARMQASTATWQVLGQQVQDGDSVERVRQLQRGQHQRVPAGGRYGRGGAHRSPAPARGPAAHQLLPGQLGRLCRGARGAARHRAQPGQEPRGALRRQPQRLGQQPQGCGGQSHWGGIRRPVRDLDRAGD